MAVVLVDAGQRLLHKPRIIGHIHRRTVLLQSIALICVIGDVVGCGVVVAVLLLLLVLVMKLVLVMVMGFPLLATTSTT